MSDKDKPKQESKKPPPQIESKKQIQSKVKPRFITEEEQKSRKKKKD